MFVVDAVKPFVMIKGITSGEEAKAIIDEAPKTALFIVNNVSSWGI